VLIVEERVGLGGGEGGEKGGWVGGGLGDKDREGRLMRGEGCGGGGGG